MSLLPTATVGVVDSSKQAATLVARPLLHAAKLTVAHPTRHGELLSFSCPVPEDFAELAKRIVGDSGANCDTNQAAETMAELSELCGF
mmetsp:Transcript_23326/g.39464  ORF Transcript_23326/g.39464 Transcript_23326/m.39464 type:complete len:88 (+) Transcript_23326:102-365(+)